MQIAVDVPVQPSIEIAQPIASATFDLRNYDTERAIDAKLLDARGCGGSADEIVVCAPDQRRFRLRGDLTAPEDSRFTATMDLAPGLTATPHVEAKEMQGGVQSNRVMMTFKLKL